MFDFNNNTQNLTTLFNRNALNNNTMLNTFSNSTQAATTATTNQGLSGLFNRFNDSLNTPNFNAGLNLANAGIGLFQAWSGYKQGKASLKEQKRVNSMLENQYKIEQQRYNKREADKERMAEILDKNM